MMQRRVQQLDLFSCQIDKGENELGLCTRIFFDPADEDEKDPGVFITEIAEGGAAHKLGCIHLFDQIIKIGETNLIGLDEEEIFSTFKKMENCVFRIEIGREPPEVKTELIILLELSEERKKFFTDSVIVQEKVGDIKIVKGKARNSKTPKISWLWITRELELKNEEMELKRIIEEEGQKYKKDLKEIDERTNNLIEKLKKYVNISEVNIGNQPEETVKEDITIGQLLAAEDISLDFTENKKKGRFWKKTVLVQVHPASKWTSQDSVERMHCHFKDILQNPNYITIKKEPVEELVEEEISSGKPAMGKAIMQFSWFCNVQGYNWRNFFCFKKHDKQVQNVRKQEETDLKLLVSDWTETQVGHWLKSIGMKKYILKFDYKRIRGQELLELDNDALKCIGITKKRDRKKILKGIKKIQQTEKN